jgi:hypothetical protein
MKCADTVAGPPERLLVISVGVRLQILPRRTRRGFLRERMELSSVLLLTKAACGPLCQRYARPVGLKAKTAALFTIGPTTQRMLSKKTARMGTLAKPLAAYRRRLCCV